MLLPCRHSAKQIFQEASRIENLLADPQYLLWTTLPNCLWYPTMQPPQDNLVSSVQEIVSHPLLRQFRRTDILYLPQPTSQFYSVASHFFVTPATILPTSCWVVNPASSSNSATPLSTPR